METTGKNVIDPALQRLISAAHAKQLRGGRNGRRCPRCGENDIKENLMQNYHSTVADLWICADCAEAEKGLIVMNAPQCVDYWRFVRDYFDLDFRFDGPDDCLQEIGSDSEQGQRVAIQALFEDRMASPITAISTQKMFCDRLVRNFRGMTSARVDDVEGLVCRYDLKNGYCVWLRMRMRESGGVEYAIDYTGDRKQDLD